MKLSLLAPLLLMTLLSCANPQAQGDYCGHSGSFSGSEVPCPGNLVCEPEEQCEEWNVCGDLVCARQCTHDEECGAVASCTCRHGICRNPQTRIAC